MGWGSWGHTCLCTAMRRRDCWVEQGAVGRQNGGGGWREGGFEVLRGGCCCNRQKASGVLASTLFNVFSLDLQVAKNGMGHHSLVLVVVVGFRLGFWRRRRRGHCSDGDWLLGRHGRRIQGSQHHILIDVVRNGRGRRLRVGEGSGSR